MHTSLYFRSVSRLRGLVPPSLPVQARPVWAGSRQPASLCSESQSWAGLPLPSRWSPAEEEGSSQDRAKPLGRLGGTGLGSPHLQPWTSAHLGWLAHFLLLQEGLCGCRAFFSGALAGKDPAPKRGGAQAESSPAGCSLGCSSSCLRSPPTGPGSSFLFAPCAPKQPEGGQGSQSSSLCHGGWALLFLPGPQACRRPPLPSSPLFPWAPFAFSLASTGAAVFPRISPPSVLHRQQAPPGPGGGFYHIWPLDLFRLQRPE